MPVSPDEPLRQFQTIELLQSNDYASITSNLQKLTPSPPSLGGVKPNYGSPLHLAVALCARTIVEWILETFVNGENPPFHDWINLPNSDGDTCLHVASKHGRLDILELLFTVSSVDDTIRNAAGKFIDEPAKTEGVRAFIKASRENYRAHLSTIVSNCITTSEYSGIYNLFASSPRAQGYLTLGWFDLNAPLDSVHEYTVLHIAAKRNEFALLDWCLSHGGDPSVKDRKGHRPIDLVSKKGDDRCRKRLKSAVTQTPILGVNLRNTTISTPSGGTDDDSDAGSLVPHSTSTERERERALSSAPSLHGTIHKWVNYASGYKSRYFTLEDGLFSYFKSEAEHPHYCRGSIRTDFADVHPDYTDKSKFEVSGAGKRVKWILKARSQAEAKKWMWALVESRQWMVDRVRKGGMSIPDESYAMEGEIDDGDSGDEEGFASNETNPSHPPLSNDNSASSLTAGLTTALGAHRRQFSDISQTYTHQGVRPSTTTESGSCSPSAPSILKSGTGATTPIGLGMTHRRSTSGIAEEYQSVSYMLNLQIDVQSKCIESVCETLKKLDPSLASEAAIDINSVPNLLRSSHTHINEYIQKLIKMVETREKFWSKKFKREDERRKRWEEVIKRMVDVEVEIEKEKLGNVGSSLNPAVGPAAIETLGSFSSARSRFDNIASSRDTNGLKASLKINKTLKIAGVDDDDDDDEFFDAVGDVGSGGIEELLGFHEYDEEEEAKLLTRRTLSRANMSLTTSPSTQNNVELGFISPSSLAIAAKSYYNSRTGDSQTFRTSLPMDSTAPRPSLSLWSFLKSAIGKDLSKVTLPVFFNEPLTMLQRLCEDVEYSELLSLAGRIGKPSEPSKPSTSPTLKKSDPAEFAAKNLDIRLDDAQGLQGEDASLMRIMLVAAYGMSNYSSTAGRTGKPFNPLLGETYEIVSDDKQFRYVAEQVCHHPPISACYCESPDYTFWGEVNVKSKFYGKSLEIHPQGNNHVRLPLYTKDEHGRTKVSGSEHYQWKKVITSVNGLILGKLWIVHYGDMVVKNWRTGEECTISFKQVSGGGWFGLGGGSDDAGLDKQIEGTVKDKTGRIRWRIKGRWDDRIVATPEPGPTTRVDTSEMMTSPLTIWVRNKMPDKAAENFHFTKFALSLNEVSPGLAKVLPPTDSRLRSDQRAMEEGKWDVADKEKTKLETIQRDRRKVIVKDFDTTGLPSGPQHLRDKGLEMGEEWWIPRWFTRQLESDSQEEHWQFSDEYWAKRERVVKAGDKWPEWVLPIFQSA